MSSRDLKESEKEGLVEIEIAKDGLAIIIHPDNPVIKRTGGTEVNLTSEQLRAIYAQEIVNWEHLGGNKAGIVIVSREAGSGTRGAFEESIMGGKRISAKAVTFSSNGAIRNYVAGNPRAIGFISLGLVGGSGHPKRVIAISVDGAAATEENIVNGTYELKRSFWFVTKGEPEGLAKEFIGFVMSEDGKRIMAGKGLIVG